VSELPEVVSDDVRRVDVPSFDAPAAVVACETFTGPALTFVLGDVPEPSSVTVAAPDGNPVKVTVAGSTVRRVEGHFGRGRWTVNYRI
jgi:hypothetical protein